ncbi:hypothetical protein [Chryseobacterium tongliaoense]
MIEIFHITLFLFVLIHNLLLVFIEMIACITRDIFLRKEVSTHTRAENK